MRSVPKPKDGDRALGITATLYALYGAITQPALDDWSGARAGFWDTAVRGSSSLRAALLRVLLAEVNAGDGICGAYAFSDFRSFYDFMGWSETIACGRALAYPLEPLALCYESR